MANLTGQLFIDGLWLEGHGDFFESLQPVTGETVWDGVSASIEDVDAAVREARSAFVHWRKRPFSERQALVENLARCWRSTRKNWRTRSVRKPESPCGNPAPKWQR